MKIDEYENTLQTIQNEKKKYVWDDSKIYIHLAIAEESIIKIIEGVKENGKGNC